MSVLDDVPHRWVSRDENGAINGAFGCQQPGLADEQVAEDNPELVVFTSRLSVKVPDISDRQFFQQLAAAGIITREEALQAVKVGVIPPPLQAIVDGIGDLNQRFAAEMVLSGSVLFRRHHPLTIAIGAARGMTEAEVDQFFIAASQL